MSPVLESLNSDSVEFVHNACHDVVAKYKGNDAAHHILRVRVHTQSQLVEYNIITHRPLLGFVRSHLSGQSLLPGSCASDNSQAQKSSENVPCLVCLFPQQDKCRQVRLHVLA